MRNVEMLDFNKKLIFGGLVNLETNSINLHSLQINDGSTIHTCNNYGNSLEIIKIASKGIENKVKIISKIYYKYPDLKHQRFRPMVNQIDEIVDRLSFIPSEWTIQICCYCKLENLISKNAKEFFLKIKKNYNISNILIETYPSYNYKLGDIEKVNKYYKNKLKFGLTGYQNLENRVFTDKMLNGCASYSIPICFIGILGKRIRNVVNSSNFKMNKILSEEILNLNLMYFIKNSILNSDIKGVTKVSNERQYYDLKERYNNLKEIFMNKDLFNYFNHDSSNINFFKDYDQYGGHYSKTFYFNNPKKFASIVKNNFISFLKSLKFSRNFWG